MAVVAPCLLLWADGGSDAYKADPVSDAVELYHYTTEVDTTAKTWLLVAVKGLAAPVLAKEEDEANLDALIAAIPASGIASPPSWAVLGWLEGATFRRDRQPAALAGTGLPPGIKGDILRHTGTDWERYGIDQGPQGSFLMNDRANSGLPIWSFIPGTSGGSGTAVINSDTSARVLPLGANASTTFAGSPPAGWQTIDFDDTSWPLGVISETDSAYISGADLIWWSAVAAKGDECLFRSSVHLAGGLVAAHLAVQVDDGFSAAYFNGSLLGSDTTFPFSPPRHVYDVTALVVPGKNVVAIWCKNDINDVVGGACYQLTVS